MSKLVVINLGNGELEKGFEQVTARLWEVGNSFPEQFIGSLPPAPELAQLYRNWRLSYQSLFDPGLRTGTLDEDDEIEIDATGITNVSSIDFNNLSAGLQQYLNNWLKSVEFLNIDRKLRSALNSTEEIRVIIETNHALLRRLPWYCWDFFDDYPKAAMALSQLEYQRIASLRQPKFPRDKVRILAVLGNSKNIDLEAEARFLESLQDAQVKFLVKPSRNTFNNYLWDSKGWDILFFAGHSKTEEETGRIYINENNTDNSLTIEQLKEALKQAIKKGLKLAIFNSCDGLGLADELQRLHIPTVIVMREPVPNLVAQKFFEYFLNYFAIEQLPLYLSVKQARKRLQGLENEFPAASWLPIICQNPGVAPPVWLDLGRHPTKINPFRGLFAFREEDARFFFGRETFTQMLVNAVQNQPFVAVVGSSGSGKSSVVFAGLVKRLRDAGEWHIIDFRPGERPLFNLATAIISQQEDNLSRTGRLRDIRNFTTDLQDCENGLRDLVDNILSENPNGCFLLVADQFEELYTLCRDSQERKAFLDRLLEVISHSHRFNAVITLRADFLGQALSYRPFADVLQYADLKLGPMTYSELQATIEKPVELLGVTIEDKLTERILSEVNPGNLPLLEFALTQLWAKQQDAQLTHAAYNEIGGVEAALAGYASEAYNQLNFEEKERAQQIFIQLVHPGLGTEDTRRVATSKEIGAENWDLVTRLADARLVVTGYDEKTNLETVEIVHEALIRNWGQLRDWMHRDRDFRHWQEQLRAAMLTWESSGCDEGALLRGKPLIDAQDWQNQRFSELSSMERSFIALSVEFRERESKNKKRRRRFTIYGLSVGLVLALSLAGLAGWQWQNAVKNEIKAINTSAKALLTSEQHFDALLESLKAWKKLSSISFSFDKQTPIKTEISNLLQEAVYKVKERNRWMTHQDEIKDVSFSPDGNIIATAGTDKTVKFWSLGGQGIVSLKRHKSSVTSITFSPDNERIATASWDGTVKLWTTKGLFIKDLAKQEEALSDVSFSPDGQTIAAADTVGNIILWDSKGQKIKSFKGHQEAVYDVTFSPDSKMIATASADNKVKLWNLDGQEIRTLSGHKDWVWSVNFNPQEPKIITASKDGTAKLWSLDGKIIKTLEAHKDALTSAAFSPDGKKIVTTSTDKTAILWSNNGEQLQVLKGHKNWVLKANFSPDSRIIATVSKDSTVKIWQVKDKPLQILPAHNDAIYSISYSPDAETIATASWDKTVKLWTKTGRLIKIINDFNSSVTDVSFSPDGQIIATATNDGNVKLFNNKGQAIKTLKEKNKDKAHQKWVWDVNFSHNGRIIATASNDGTAKLWKSTGEFIRTLDKQKEGVNSVTFSPDDKTIATGGWDKTIKLWKSKGELIRIIEGHKDAVHSVIFSPDGSTIASASEDKTVKLWTLKGRLIKDIPAHDAGVFNIIFSPDGKKIATASLDRTVKLWSRDGKELKTFKAHDDSVWSLDFNPKHNTLASGDNAGKLILWNLDLKENNLVDYGCNWVRDYLKNNANKETRNYCESIVSQK